MSSFGIFESSTVSSAIAVSEVDASEGLSFNGPCAAAGGALFGFMVSEMIADSSSQLVFSLCNTDCTQGTVIAAHIAAQMNGTAHPNIISLTNHNLETETHQSHKLSRPLQDGCR